MMKNDKRSLVEWLLDPRDTRALRVQRYVDGELSAKEREAFEAEMTQSDTLRTEVESRTRQIDTLRSLPSPEPNAHVWRAIRAGLDQPKTKPRVVMAPRPVPSWTWRLAPVAAMVLVVWVGMITWQSSAPRVQVIEVVEVNGFGDEAELLLAHHDLVVESPDMRRSLSELYPEATPDDE